MIFKCFICKEAVCDILETEDHPGIPNSVTLISGPNEISICNECFKNSAPPDIIGALRIGENPVRRELRTISLRKFWSHTPMMKYVHNLYCENCKINLLDAYNDYYNKTGSARETLEYFHAHVSSTATEFCCYKCNYNNITCWFN